MVDPHYFYTLDCEFITQQVELASKALRRLMDEHQKAE